MDDSHIVRVSLIGSTDDNDVGRFEAFNHILRQIQDDAYIHVYKPDTIFLFLHPCFCPKLGTMIPPSPYGKFTNSLLFYKHERGVSRISKTGHINLNQRLKNQYNDAVGRIRHARYDVTRQRFIDTEKSRKIRLSKRIQPADRVISFREEYSRHETRYRRNKNATVNKGNHFRGYIRSKYADFHKVAVERAFPLDSGDYDLPLSPDVPVQATDGPYENVDFHLSTITANLTLEEQAPSRPRAPCRHPDYANAGARRESFSRWPHQHGMQDIDELVKYGFFYAGPSDIVRCYQCGLSLKDWSHVEDPLQEHVRFSPQCVHLAETVAIEELDRYRAMTHGLTNTREANAAYPYRHPEYKALETRLRTFTRWPSNLSQTPAQVAEAGFYYTGFQDQVRCYACDGGLQHWDIEDEPWIEHARWFPHCVHVRTFKGEPFITFVQMALQDADDEQEIDFGADTYTAGPAVNGASGGQLESDDPIYSQEAQKVIINFGFSKAAVKMAIQECSEKGMRWNSNILADLLFDKQTRGEVLPTDSPRPESPVHTTSDVSTAEGVADDNKRLLNRMKCIMCEEHDSNVLFLPCAHLKMCVVCAADVTMCPMCGKTVKEKVKTFMA